MLVIRTHAEGKLSKIFNITFVILPFSHEITFISILFILEPTLLDETIKCHTKNAKFRVRLFQVYYLRTSHSCPLYE